MILVYITNPNEETATNIATKLIESRLIACANIFPIKSVYRWKERITNENEWVLIAKTDDKKYGKLVKRIKELHPYKIPVILKIPAKANADFEEWLMNEISD